MISVDLSILQTLYAIRSAPLAHFFILLSTIGDTATMIGITIIVVALLFLWFKEKALAIGLLSTMTVSTAITYGLKEVVARSRPDLMYQAYAETGYSFPSGHSSAAAAFFGFFAYIVWKTLPKGSARVLILFALLFYILLMGFGRLYLGVHYLSDVLAGYIVGLAAAWAGLYIQKTLRKRFALNPEV